MLLSNSKESPVFRRGESQLQTPGVITYRTLIGQTFWSYDDPVTVWLKTAYVRLREPGGLGGAFVWALKDDDANGTIVRTMAAGLRQYPNGGLSVSATRHPSS